ncbi:MAG TPA: hypothetical protein VHD60_02560 [Candidatus Saccharimonadales bacterium]|nr:hypothetical protein [Candidatus Saccharimonadales bacterium]
MQPLHLKHFIRTETDYDDYDKYNELSYPKQGKPANEGWALIEPTPKPEDGDIAAQPSAPMSVSDLLGKGYMHAGSRFVPERLPDEYGQVGGVTVIKQGGYPTTEAAIVAEAADKYYHMLQERYGAENVAACIDESRIARAGEVAGQQVAYFVRLDTHVPEMPSTEQAS